MLRIFWLLLVCLVSTAWRRLRSGPLRPTWSLRFEVLIAFMRRDWRTVITWPPAKIRGHFERLPQPKDAVRRVRREATSTADVPGARFIPPGAPGDRVILYLPGGAYVFGSTRTHADIMARLALATGIEVLGLDTRLAPEHPYPAALEDANAVYQGLLERGVAAERIVLAGDSAGGNLCLALMLALREQARPLPGCALLLSPWLDLESRRPSVRRNAAYDYATGDMLISLANLYAGEISLADERISPIHAPPAGLPPLLVQVGGAELLEDECREFADAARAAGVDVTMDVLVDMPHAAQLFAAFVPEGARAIERAAAFLRAREPAPAPGPGGEILDAHARATI